MPPSTISQGVLVHIPKGDFDALDVALIVLTVKDREGVGARWSIFPDSIDYAVTREENGKVRDLRASEPADGEFLDDIEFRYTPRTSSFSLWEDSSGEAR